VSHLENSCNYTDYLLSIIGVIKPKPIFVVEDTKVSIPFKPSYKGEEPPF